MKALFSVLISLYLIPLILNACYQENPSSVSQCENAKSGSDYCCLVEFRTDSNSEYRKLCVPIKEDDIEDGKFEETIGTIEGGNYTGSNWDETISANFKNYASIDNFDCEGSYLYYAMMLFSLILFLF